MGPSKSLSACVRNTKRLESKMGNIAFFSSRKNISDEQLVEKLETLVSERFPGGIIEVHPQFFKGEICSWVVGPKEELCGEKNTWQHELEFHRSGPRKFGTKYPHSDWGIWLMFVILNNMAFRCNGRVSDESDNITNAGDPNKHTTFLTYLDEGRAWRVKIHGVIDGNRFHDLHQEAVLYGMPAEMIEL